MSTSERKSPQFIPTSDKIETTHPNTLYSLGINCCCMDNMYWMCWRKLWWLSVRICWRCLQGSLRLHLLNVYSLLPFLSLPSFFGQSFFSPSLSSSSFPSATSLTTLPPFFLESVSFCFCYKDAVVSIHIMTWFNSRLPFSPPPPLPPPSYSILPWYWVWCRQIKTVCVSVSQCFQTCLPFPSSQKIPLLFSASAATIFSLIHFVEFWRSHQGRWTSVPPFPPTSSDASKHAPIIENSKTSQAPGRTTWIYQ